MASPVRRADSPISVLFKDSPQSFGFFQVVRLLQLFDEQGGAGQPSIENRIRFPVHNSLAFPAGEIQDVSEPKPGFCNVAINFLGLTGPIGVLPAFYTDYLIELGLNRDRSGSEFLDIFNTRFAWLFYRAWEKHHIFTGYERNLSSPQSASSFRRYLLSIVGLGTAGLTARAAVPDDVFLYYGGLFAQQPRSAINLEALLRDFFRVRAEVIQFEGAWVDLDRESLCWLDQSSPSNQLGFGAVAGDQVWNANARFRIRLGPLSFKQYVGFLPGEADYIRLLALTRFFVDRRADFAVQLVLAANEVPSCQLGPVAESRLGYSTWLKPNEASAMHDADDLVMFDQREQ